MVMLGKMLVVCMEKFSCMLVDMFCLILFIVFLNIMLLVVLEIELRVFINGMLVVKVVDSVCVQCVMVDLQRMVLMIGSFSIVWLVVLWNFFECLQVWFSRKLVLFIISSIRSYYFWSMLEILMIIWVKVGSLVLKFLNIDWNCGIILISRIVEMMMVMMIIVIGQVMVFLILVFSVLVFFLQVVIWLSRVFRVLDCLLVFIRLQQSELKYCGFLCSELVRLLLLVIFCLIFFISLCMFGLLKFLLMMLNDCSSGMLVVIMVDIWWVNRVMFIGLIFFFVFSREMFFLWILIGVMFCLCSCVLIRVGFWLDSLFLILVFFLLVFFYMKILVFNVLFVMD